MEQFVGIADCHGLESFLPAKEVSDSQLSMWDIRAISNDQRHALVYKVDLSIAASKAIKKLLESTEKFRYEKALREIKKHAKNVNITKGREHSWDIIPNRTLDPWNPKGIE